MLLLITSHFLTKKRLGTRGAKTRLCDYSWNFGSGFNLSSSFLFSCFPWLKPVLRVCTNTLILRRKLNVARSFINLPDNGKLCTCKKENVQFASRICYLILHFALAYINNTYPWHLHPNVLQADLIYYIGHNCTCGLLNFVLYEDGVYMKMVYTR